MTQAVLALSDIYVYPAPMAFQLKDFKQVQASVFQVTRAPGRYIVYLGCALLILGVFAMLHAGAPVWVWLSGHRTAARRRGWRCRATARRSTPTASSRTEGQAA